MYVVNKVNLLFVFVFFVIIGYYYFFCVIKFCVFLWVVLFVIYKIFVVKYLRLVVRYIGVLVIMVKKNIFNFI